MDGTDAERRSRRTVIPQVLAGFFAAAILVGWLLHLFPTVPDPTCVSLLEGTEEPPITLPENCSRTTRVDSDKMVEYLDAERARTGLMFKEWITCQGIPARPFGFTNDPHWLPSYLPGKYQYRRTVIIMPVGPAAPKGSPVMAEICLMPRRSYLLQIAGQCNGKFAVWK